jgi:DNA-directed RNA polymerase subunit RPC12/RpoP
MKINCCECGKPFTTNTNKPFTFCPHCGTKMRLVQDGKGKLLVKSLIERKVVEINENGQESQPIIKESTDSTEAHYLGKN